MIALADFVLACIADDEAVARKAAPGPWMFGRPGDSNIWGSVSKHQADLIARDIWPKNAAHITLWDPARVLAECEAKREIVKRETAGRQMRFDDRYGHAVFDGLTLQGTVDSAPVLVDSVNGYPVYSVEQTRELLDRYSEPITDTPVLRLLAVPYAGRPGYQPEWRP